MNVDLLLFNSLLVTFLVVRYSYVVWKRPERFTIAVAFYTIIFAVNFVFSTFNGIEAAVRAAATTAVYVTMAALMIWIERRRAGRGGAGSAEPSHGPDR